MAKTRRAESLDSNLMLCLYLAGPLGVHATARMVERDVSNVRKSLQRLAREGKIVRGPDGYEMTVAWTTADKYEQVVLGL